MRRRAAAKPTAPGVAPLTECIDAERAARRVGALEGFLRETRRCRNCQELVEVTWRMRPASTFLFWGRAARGG